ncbi:lytic transglycosylase domain-containing protein [Burkholderia mayonis]|uniref:Transglycosylase SLT domain-containing protein n=1 Tax=Burkholderia mayonis TaxID=1385591 RepID=A0A1B4G329_9BURK|nr:lytic transglycosylase domain-containing protein [Burkholderia mayonis]AOJ10334.1 hypothetical protein WS71_24300 [Burkholderia mayonis]KVE53684.1 hypothetical protein WS71_06470 [Burkholderia mayonis]
MANGYNASAFPVSYRDPAYDQADQAASAAVGIPAQLLTNIRTKGEKSNADRISSAGAATPYQIIPSTRDTIIKQTGVDPWLNPQTAAYGAAYLLKQSMDRNGGNPVLATAEYHGGTDRDAWGPKTMAYVKRVAGMSPNNPDATNPYAVQALPAIGTAPGALQPTPQGSQPSSSNPYAVALLPNIGAPPGAVDSGPSGLQLAYDAYQSGRMSPEDSAQFEQDVRGGRIVLPAGMNVKAAPQPPMAPQQAVDAFNTGRMSPEDAQQFQQDVNSGALALPHGAVLTPQQPETVGRVAGVAARGFLQGAATSWQNAVQTAANPTKVPLPIAVINQVMQSAPQVADQIFGTHLASNVTPQQAVEQSGLPRAQNAREQIVQQGAEGAGGMAVPLGALSTIPKMIAAGAAGGTVGEAVHQATGNHMLGVAANLLTTALSPVVASRVMAALARELPQAGAAAAEGGAAEANQAASKQAAAASQEAAVEQAQMGAQTTAAGADINAAKVAEAASPEAVAASAENQTAAQAGTQAAAPTEGAINPAASPLASAAQDFMSTDELAAQTRKATGIAGAPFGIGKRNAQQTLAAQMAPDPERLAAAERLGIADNLQPDHLTTNQAAIELMQAIKSMPGSVARSEEMQGLQQIGQRAQQLVDDLGGTRDLSELSGQVKGELMNTQQQLDQKAEALYQGLNADINPKMPVEAPNVLGFIQKRADELTSPRNLSGIEKMIQAKLTPREQPIVINGQRVQGAQIGIKPPMQQPTYALLDDVRREIGAGLKNQGDFKNADTGMLKKLYALISDDQRGALASSGVPDALKRFDLARSTVQMRKSVEDDMTSLFGKQLGDSLVGKLGTAMAAAAKGDETKLVGMLKSVPPSMRQNVMSSGLAYAFGKATKNGELNFKTFADWYDGLKKNSAAHNVVMANLPPEARQQLIDLATVSRGIANATRENITTGRIMAAREALNARADGLIGNIYNVARRAAVGRLGIAASAGAASIAGPIGAGLMHAVFSTFSKGKVDVMKAADELVVSPQLRAWTKAGAIPSPEAVNALANSPQFRRWFDLARSLTATNDQASRVRWILGTLNAAESASNINSNGNR